MRGEEERRGAERRLEGGGEKGGDRIRGEKEIRGEERRGEEVIEEEGRGDGGGEMGPEQIRGAMEKREEEWREEDSRRRREELRGKEESSSWSRLK